MGVSARTISIEELRVTLLELESRPGGQPTCLAMSACTLARIFQKSEVGAKFQTLLETEPIELLVFGWTDEVEHQRSLLQLSAGRVSEIKALNEQSKQFLLPRAAGEVSAQLAGLAFPGSYEEPPFAFGTNSSEVETIMLADEHAVFVRFQSGKGRIYLIGGPLADIRKPLHRKRGVEHYYGPLVPPLVFLRGCFAATCWQALRFTARLTIDDPLLSSRYGFLDYGELERSMELHRYGTSIAFIPWNWWRTKRKMAARWLGAHQDLTICVHGCDHTEREFETPDAALLDVKAALAMQRMQSQQKRTGATFEAVMIFPQGRFSKAAINALRANRFLAAVNTTVFPIDHGPMDITIADLLRPAVTRYDGFPIFMRHYSRKLFDIAFDIFLGKPALLVEHHQAFRDGCAAMETVVGELHKVEPSLTWPSLSDQLMNSCLLRTRPNGINEVMFFTKQFRLMAPGARSGRFLLMKQEPDAERVKDVLVDDERVPFSIDGGVLRIAIEAHTGQLRRIEIVDRERASQAVGRLGVAYNTGVLLRRGLSEARDNVLARSDRFRKSAKALVKGLKIG